MIQSLFDQTVTDTTLIYSIMSFQYFIILNYEFYYLIHKQNELTSRLSIYLSLKHWILFIFTLKEKNFLSV